MNNKTAALQKANEALRTQIEQKRASRRLFALEDGGGVPETPQKVSRIIAHSPTPSSESPQKTIQPIAQQLRELILEVDHITRKPINLSEKHGVTPQLVSQLTDVMDRIGGHEFITLPIVPESLQEGMMLDIKLEGFEYFRILKICTTLVGENLCVVNLKKPASKKGKTDLLIVFPQVENGFLKLYSPKTQEFLGEYKILSFEITKRNLFEKILSSLGFGTK